jgi:transporter family-2 protein
MNALLYVLSLIAGLGLAVQVGLNSTMRQSTGSAAFAALVSFCVGLIALVLFVAATRVPVPTRAALTAAPAWAWLGGVFGAFYVAMATVAGPRLGATTLLALTLLGQVTASLILDHFGWLGFAQQTLSATRILGATLLVAGVLLISR